MPTLTAVTIPFTTSGMGGTRTLMMTSDVVIPSPPTTPTPTPTSGAGFPDFVAIGEFLLNYFINDDED